MVSCDFTMASESDFIISRSSLTFKEEIGRGGFTNVWLVDFVTPTGNVIQAVAKKVMRASVELQVMKKINHENVIKCHGISVDDQDECHKYMYIIMELAQMGDLRHFLDRWKSQHPHQLLPMALVGKWAFEAASGLRYMHEQNYSHRDIKSANYLVMTDLTLKLGDFGLATVLDRTQSTEGNRGTCRWMAPEVIVTQLRSPKSDIFALGTVVWEMLTLEIPFMDCRGDFQVMTAICSGKRPDVPDFCPQQLRKVMLQCWEHDYHKRPSMDNVCKQLHECKFITL